MTYTLEIPVDHSLAMDVDQPPSDTSKLGDSAMVNEAMAARFWMENLQARTDLHLDVPSRTH